MIRRMNSSWKSKKISVTYNNGLPHKWQFFKIKKKRSNNEQLPYKEYALMVGDIGLEPMTPCL